MESGLSSQKARRIHYEYSLYPFLIDDMPFFLIQDPDVADYIFNSRAQKNYTRRPASAEGLKMLGMHHQGLIWNNELTLWKQVRGCFQMSLNEHNMENAVRTIKTNVTLLIEAHLNKKTGFIDMMSICRQLTFRATLSTFFGIDASEYSDMVRSLSFSTLDIHSTNIYREYSRI